jgi:hypothetical protein
MNPRIRLSDRLNYREMSPTMTTPANAIKNEIRELIQVQIERFGKPSSLTSSEIHECQTRAERIKMLGQELDRIGRMAILEERFSRAF